MVNARSEGPESTGKATKRLQTGAIAGRASLSAACCGCREIGMIEYSRNDIPGPLCSSGLREVQRHPLAKLGVCSIFAPKEIFAALHDTTADQASRQGYRDISMITEGSRCNE